MTDDDFLKLYDEYADAIFRHCFFRVFNRELARDMTQETFFKTWDYMRAGNRLDNPKAFLYRVATNLVIDHARRRKEASLDDLKEKGFDPVIEDEGTGRRADIFEKEAVLRALETLPQQYRDVVALRYIDDLTPREIALVLDLSVNNVSVRIHRGVEMLRARLNTGPDRLSLPDAGQIYEA